MAFQEFTAWKRMFWGLGRVNSEEVGREVRTTSKMKHLDRDKGGKDDLENCCMWNSFIF